MYNADTMHHFLGSGGTDEQAQLFAEYLYKYGWELVETADGLYKAYHNDGQEMTETEWQDTLQNCFGGGENAITHVEN